MKKLIIILFAVFAISAWSNNTFAQDKRFAIGVGVGFSRGINEASQDERTFGSLYGGYLLYINGFGSHFTPELAFTMQSNGTEKFGGFSQYKNTQIVPEFRVRWTFFEPDASFNPYLALGVGANMFTVDSVPSNPNPESENEGTALSIPVLLGFTYALSENLGLDFNFGLDMTTNDNLNPVWDDLGDGNWIGRLGLHYAFGGGDPNLDSDGDGLTDIEEEDIYKTDPNNPDTDGDGLMDGKEINSYKTDPNNPDTDGDSLKDGEEVNNYKTNPNNEDTDGEGLKDGDEVNKYKTNPNKPDSDNDGLTDAREVNKYKTNPNNPDSDRDGLKDGDEVNKYKTNPMNPDTDGGGVKDGDEVRKGINPLLKSDDKKPADSDNDGLTDDYERKIGTNPNNPDSDGDGLKDGEEVNRYKTNPMNPDTDNGGIKDGVEVRNHANPLKADDDILNIAVGDKIVLRNIVFATGKSIISPKSASILNMVHKALKSRPEMKLSIVGHTDNVGRRKSNIRLSKNRAAAVKAWLVKRGIKGNRLTTDGKGPDEPVVPNTTKENKQMNRRVEFYRVK